MRSNMYVPAHNLFLLLYKLDVISAPVPRSVHWDLSVISYVDRRLLGRKRCG
jgi:hypothetical protein